MSYTPKRSTSWYEIMHLPIIGDFPLSPYIFAFAFPEAINPYLTSRNNVD
jgi:hypothetical protein